MIKLRRIIKNTVILIVGQAVSLLSTILLSFAYGHFLGAFIFGELYFATTFVSLLGIPLSSGYIGQIIRDVAQKPDNAARLFSNVLFIKLGIWLITYIALLLIPWLLGYSFEVRILIGICGFDLLCNAIVATFMAMHYAFEQTIFPVVGGTLEKALTTLLGILLLRAGAGVQVMAVVLVIGSLVNALWQAIWYFRMVGISLVIEPKLIREILRTNIPFLISGLLMVGYTNIDTVLLSLMTNTTVVGLYGAVARIVDTISSLPGILMMVIIYPFFSKLATTSDAELKLAFEKSMNLMLFCAMPITALMLVVSPNIIGILYGSGFTQAAPALQAFAPFVFFVFINNMLVAVVLSKRIDKIILINAGAALVFNLGLNLIMIPLFQAIGSAIVTSLTEILICTITVFAVPRHLLPFGSLWVALKALIASVLMAIVILPLHTLPLFVILSIAMLVYIGASLLLGTLPREDYVAVYHAIRQKKQPTSSSGIGSLAEVPTQAYYPDTVLNIESAITMKLPVFRLQTLPDSRVPSLFAYELAITMKLPVIRPQPMQQRHLKPIRLQPMSPLPPTRQRKDDLILEEWAGTYGDSIE